VHCAKCGTPLDEADDFCPRCGSAVATQSPVPAEAPANLVAGLDFSLPTMASTARTSATPTFGPLPSVDLSTPLGLSDSVEHVFDPTTGAPLAEWWQRAVALIVDWLIVGIPTTIVFVAIVLAGTTTVTRGGSQVRVASQSALLLGYLVYLVVWFSYFVVLTGGEHGQTLGKRALGIAVRDASRDVSIGYARAAGRYGVIAGLTLFVPLVLADYLSPLWSVRHQAWHDMASRSIVVVVPKAR
jgi:uncharacterized RDD family membrane protein YckC